jgi:DNA invertase Pin-like site-specific DNA recombinase
VRAVLGATQKTLEEWGQKIKDAILVKKQELETYEEKKRQLLPILMEGHEKKVSTRQLEKITGINRTTIARWIKEAKESKGNA